MVVKRSKDVTKFKICCENHFYTLCTSDSEKVGKLKPPSQPHLQFCLKIVMYNTCVASSRYASTVSTHGLEGQGEVIGKLFLKKVSVTKQAVCSHQKHKGFQENPLTYCAFAIVVGYSYTTCTLRK
jgi:hypothetical protein